MLVVHSVSLIIHTIKVYRGFQPFNVGNALIWFQRVVFRGEVDHIYIDSGCGGGGHGSALAVVKVERLGLLEGEGNQQMSDS